ncbi:MAG: TIR domain-containing protein [Phycisphaerales bacterium]|nr:TIR domain-containing protein [Phycisphaerales bacterium]MCB9837083.1 TIR domain-containing protein [Phycisphaera sp.]
MAKKRVFISFDYDNDRALKDFMIGQAKHTDSPFEIINMSLKEAAPEREWLAKARAAITRSEIVIVMLGSKTKSASGVLKEIAIANELKKTTFQIIGYKDGSSSWAVPGAGRVYRWDWENLKKLLA